MNPVVLEVGPVTVRGPESAPPEWVGEAIAGIDDRITIIDDQLVEVAALWRDVLAAATGARPEAVVVVLPSWWSAARAATVTTAARAVAGDVVVRRRAQLLAAEGGATVVEVSDDIAVVATPGARPQTVERESLDLAALLADAGPVLVDVPAGVRPPRPAPGAEHTDRDRVVRAASAGLPCRGARARARPGRRGAAVLAGCGLAFAAAAVGWLTQPPSGRGLAESSPALLVEGRVAVQVPPQWRVERITAGPGSARVRVSAPGGLPAVHLTQSVTTGAAALPDAAESLQRAIESAPAGVFVDFRPDSEVAGRPAVTYREVRAGSRTDWAVVVDADVRIAVGCQSAPGAAEAIRAVCEQAVRSVHVVH